MPALHSNLRNNLEKTIVKARDEAEAGARAALERLAVDAPKPFEHLDEEQRLLRRKLRAHARQVGDKSKKNDSHEITHLVGECAYEHWHRMLFARFLAENSLLMHPEGVAVTLEECDELAAEKGTDRWTLAAGYASRMLPQIFRPDDPLLQVTLAPEDKRTLERLVADLPVKVFTADDSLGWCYQFWQTKRKEEVNKSEVKIGADELPAVTQLFTEDYMVRFLLHNSLGAWWAGKQQPSGRTEDQLRKSLSDTLEEYEFDYLRFMEEARAWRPASGTFDGWPGKAAELKILDPCCGSGHFLVAVFELMARIRMAEEGLSREDATDAVIRENLFGLEIDPRCTQLAAFSVALAAWRFCGFYRQLPPMRIACSGLAPHSKREDWKELAGDDQNLSVALGWLYDEFENAPTLGSLINPATSESSKLVDWKQLVPLMQEATREETNDFDQHELGIAARGIADAARLLADKYHLVITNVPYRTRGDHCELLQNYLSDYHPHAKADLATAFVERCVGFCRESGSTALVTPQNWLFLTTYKKLRRTLLQRETWNHIARLGSGAFDTISGEVVNVALLIHSRTESQIGHSLTGIDASRSRSAGAKSLLLQTEPIQSTPQAGQLENPDARLILEEGSDLPLLSKYASGVHGFGSKDSSRFFRQYWEACSFGDDWQFMLTTVENHCEFGGLEQIVYWQNGTGVLAELGRQGRAIPAGKTAWGKWGVAVSQIGSLPTAIHIGDIFDKNVAVVLPNDPNHLLSIWCFCSSPQFNEEVRKIDQKLNVTNSTLVKVPFDLEHWQREARQKYPGGLPKPYSDDPTQWIFHGRPEVSETNKDGISAQLHVAIARLLGYRWPAELDDEMELSDEARALVQRCDELLDLVDDDGIVGVPPVRGELPAADRLRKMLARAYGDDWSPAKEGELLADSGFKNKTLDRWLRDGFFKQHCNLFHNRPFIWHIWDGHKNGFQALVNYHRLAHGEQGYKLLETLAFTYLGDWIRQLEKAQGSDGTAETRLIHSRALQENLHRILDGESPYDIFVRWKPLEEQPIGWRPDLNDGVRINIRPFMTVEQPGGKKGAGVLREKPNINWNKDRGKDVESAPWYHLGPE